MPITNKVTARNYNIDLIRIISMFMVLTLHCMYYGGLYEKSYSMGGVNLYSVWFAFLHSLCSISVNLYVLISGYFLVNQRFRLSRVLGLVCEVAFYSWSIFALELIYHGYQGISIKMFLSALLPVSYAQYWYASTYIAMCILSPVLNLFIRLMNRRQHYGVIIVLVCVFSALNTVLPLSQIMGVRRFGQSLPWFVVLYIIGSFIRLYINNNKIWKKARGGFWLCIIFMNVSWIIAMLFVGLLHLNVFDERIGTMVKYYYSFDSLPCLVASISFFLWFRSYTITNKFLIKIIRRITPLLFGVYLIHCNPYTMRFVWFGIMDCQTFTPLFPIYAIVYTVMLYILCLSIDFLRYELSEKVGSNNNFFVLSAKLDKGIYTLFDKIYVKTVKLVS